MHKKIKGIDLGFNSVKEFEEKLVTFPSVVAPLFHIRMALHSVNGHGFRFAEPECVVGEEALKYGKGQIRRYDDKWVASETWYRLFLAAAVSGGNPPEEVVVGLPVENFQELRTVVKQRLEGYHHYRLEGEERQGFLLSRVNVTMQPFGTLVHMALADDGSVRDPVCADGNIGVVDLGGKTTNLLRAVEMVEVPQETVSFPIGGWQAAEALEARLHAKFPELTLPDHALDLALRTRVVRYNGKTEAIDDLVDESLNMTVERIHAEMSKVWDIDKMASFDRIVLTGGGALLFGAALQAFLPRAVIVSDALSANVRGYRKLGLFG